MKRILILVNAYSQLQSGLNQAARLKTEFEGLGVSCDIKNNDFFPVVVDGCNLSTRISGYDACIYLDKDKYVSEMLEKSGLRLFNTHAAIRVCDDKTCTYISLSGHGVKMVKTLPGLLCYTDGAVVKPQTLDIIERELGYPVVVKESYGSLGKGVYMASNRAELQNLANRLIHKEHLFQQAVTTSLGTDVRVIVIGGKVIAAMRRRSEVDFRSNIELGGEGEKIELLPEFADTAVRAADALGLDYCGVDLLYGADGEPIVCEVNSNAFFGGIEGVTGVNVGRAYAEYVYNVLYR